MRPLRALRSRSLSALAVLVLLIGTAAPALARMTCVMSGRSVVSLGLADGCCPQENDRSTPVVKATCCEVVHTQPQRSAFLSSPAPGPLQSGAMPVSVVAAPAPSVLHVPGWSSLPFLRPPPDTGRRLAAMGTLSI